jgi:two-component system, NtrC family, response regulator HydG
MTTRATVLVVDDEPGLAEGMAESLQRIGMNALACTSGREALRTIEENEVDIVLTDLVMRDVGGMDVLRAAKQRNPDCEVIVISGQGGVEAAVEAMQGGAATYIRKPLSIEEVRAVVEKQIDRVALLRRREELERRVDESYGITGVVGRSEAMRNVLTLVRQVADSNATILVLGESGTGKELIAQAIHRLSRRRQSAFVAINCAAMSETLLESELFGHEKGAFTGAVRNHRGKFEYADGGTLFLDEIGDMPLTLQAKLLRVLESREVVRVGANESIKVDVRIVAATNRDLEAAVREGRFREDLYFRIKVVTIRLPPLRERKEDVAPLVDRFVKEFAALHGRNVKTVGNAAMAKLAAFAWPGNVRQLRNVVETAVLVTPGDTIEVANLPPEIASLDTPQAAPAVGATVSANGTPAAVVGDEGFDGLVIRLDEAERILIRNALRAKGGNREQAAKALGISERTLYRKIKEYGARVTG